jgi:hypothetical protein
MMEKRKIPASATNKTLVIKPEVSNFTEWAILSHCSMQKETLNIKIYKNIILQVFCKGVKVMLVWERNISWKLHFLFLIQNCAGFKTPVYVEQEVKHCFG